jgi:hypothetical protein
MMNEEICLHLKNTKHKVIGSLYQGGGIKNGDDQHAIHVTMVRNELVRQDEVSKDRSQVQ